mmetsp:Transcript_32310/g.75482  ORF Transcript_32310/g.75482 Transcript_32310/m.75482 type:complete len:276 (+) Transcript_32310:211-1038(+)
MEAAELAANVDVAVHHAHRHRGRLGPVPAAREASHSVDGSVLLGHEPVVGGVDHRTLCDARQRHVLPGHHRRLAADNLEGATGRSGGGRKRVLPGQYLSHNDVGEGLLRVGGHVDYIVVVVGGGRRCPHGILEVEHNRVPDRGRHGGSSSSPRAPNKLPLALVPVEKVGGAAIGPPRELGLPDGKADRLGPLDPVSRAASVDGGARASIQVDLGLRLEVAKNLKLGRVVGHLGKRRHCEVDVVSGEVRLICRNDTLVPSSLALGDADPPAAPTIR